jgi:hypothetical protein
MKRPCSTVSRRKEASYPRGAGTSSRSITTSAWTGKSNGSMVLTCTGKESRMSDHEKLWGYCTRKGDVGDRARGFVLASSHKQAREKAEAMVRRNQIEPRRIRARVWIASELEV